MARRGRKFCNQKCANEAKKGKTPPGFAPGKVVLMCLQCGQKFETWKAWVRRGRRKFCSWDCKMAYQRTLTGEKSARLGVPHSEETKEKLRTPKPKGGESPSWQGGKYSDKRGYRYVHLENLKEETQNLVAPMVMKSGYIAEHRLVMAVELGRPLTRQEKVHHVNGDQSDNRPENLQVFPEGGHSRKHREVDRELSKVRKENELLRREIERLRSLLATCQNNG